MVSEKEKNYVGQLIWLCVAVYFMSYISRINLSAIVVAVTQSGFASKKIVSLALTASSLSYGGGQVISGYLGSKYRPQTVIFAGFLITGAMNLCVALIQNSFLLIPVWTINGFAQALMWPPLVAIMAKYLRGDDYSKGCVKISYGSSSATILIYLISPLIIKFFGFKGLFVLCSVAAFAMAVIWKIKFETLTGHDHFQQMSDTIKKKDEETKSGGATGIVWIILGVILLAIVMQGILRDGVTTWMPSYVSETFHLDGKIAILTGVVMPIFSIISFKAAAVIHRRWLNNELVCAGVIFMVGAIASVALSLLSDTSVLLSVFLSAVLVGCMHGVNLLLVCLVPLYFKKYVNVSLISGVFNSCVYVGSAISTYGIVVYSQQFGWQATIALWAVIALIGTALCFLFAKKWKTEIKEEVE